MKRKNTIGWKVLRIYKGRRVSACPAPAPAVRYRIRRWAVPHRDSGPLCVFLTHSAAEEFFLKYYASWKLELWRCSYRPSAVRDVWRPTFFWGRRFPVEKLPSGTVLACGVELLRRVA